MKKYWIRVLALWITVSLVSCDSFRNHATLVGTVTEVYESSVLMETEIGPCVVSLPEGAGDLQAGDTVEIRYSGEIATSYPMQIHHVYAIKRVDPIETE